MREEPIGAIRKVELRDTIKALALARPDLIEGLALIAVATGIDEYVNLHGSTTQLIVECRAKRLDGSNET